MQLGMSRFTAAGALVLALGAGAIGGAMTSGGGGQDPAVPPTIGMKVADQATVEDEPVVPAEATPAPTPVPVLEAEAGPVAAPVPAAGQDEPSVGSPDADAAQAAADRAKREADRAEKAADRAEEVVKTPAPTPAPVVTPKPTPERECAPEGHVARETQSQSGKVLRTRTVTCTNGKQIYGPWEYPPAPTPTPAAPPPSE